MNVLIVLPIVVPLLGAAFCLVVPSREPLHKAVIVLSTAIMLAGAVVLLFRVSDEGIQVTTLGGWAAPMGIVLVADLFSSIMLVMTGIIGVAVGIYSLTAVHDYRRAPFGYYPLFLILIAGVAGAFLTGDFFNLFVWFEVMLIASFVMITLGGSRAQMEGAIKYVTLNILASVFFLTTLGLLYSVAGTLNFADLAVRLQDAENQGLITALSVLFIVAFGIKAAMFPFFFWLPSSYHTPPVPIVALFAGLLTKVGVYALIRVFTLIFTDDVNYTHTLILVLSGFTMVTGVLGTVIQMDFRKILSFHIISQIGYMTMGLGLFTVTGLAGSIYFLIHIILAKTNLFLISGLVYRLRGSFDLKVLGGMSSHTFIAVLFIVSAASLAGIPPLSGFFAKLTLVQAGLEVSEYEIVAAALATGFVTLFSMTKIWNEVFAKAPEPREYPQKTSSLAQMAPAAIMAALIIVVGVGAGPLLDLSFRAAEQLLDPSQYISAVLEEPL